MEKLQTLVSDCVKTQLVARASVPATMGTEHRTFGGQGRPPHKHSFDTCILLPGRLNPGSRTKKGYAVVASRSLSNSSTEVQVRRGMRISASQGAPEI